MISSPTVLGCIFILVLILQDASAFAPIPQWLIQRPIEESQQQPKRCTGCYPYPEASNGPHARRGGPRFGNNDDDDGIEESTSLEEFLDKPFFDPDAYDDSDKSLLGRLAAFVRQDYELAETIYVGILFVVLVIISQELLRMKLYGDYYTPFSSGSSHSGRLF